MLIFYLNVIILGNGSINGSTWIPNMLEPRRIYTVGVVTSRQCLLKK